MLEYAWIVPISIGLLVFFIAYAVVFITEKSQEGRSIILAGLALPLMLFWGMLWFLWVLFKIIAGMV